MLPSRRPPLAPSRNRCPMVRPRHDSRPQAAPASASVTMCVPERGGATRWRRFVDPVSPHMQSPVPITRPPPNAFQCARCGLPPGRSPSSTEPSAPSGPWSLLSCASDGSAAHGSQSSQPAHSFLCMSAVAGLRGRTPSTRARSLAIRSRICQLHRQTPAGERGVARRYAQLARPLQGRVATPAHLLATCLPFLPGTTPAWSNHAFPGTTAVVVELPAGPVGPAALVDHLRAVRAMELDERPGPARAARRSDRPAVRSGSGAPGARSTAGARPRRARSHRSARCTTRQTSSAAGATVR